MLKYRSLGIIKNTRLPGFRYFEHAFLLWVHDILTTKWGLVQGGTNEGTLAIWKEIFMTLELDKKAQADLMLLAHMGVAGRCEANEIIWDLLSIWAIKHEYQDLSNKATNIVFQARRHLERPPETHQDRGQWRWQKYWEPRHPQWSPWAVPQSYVLITGEGGIPLAPPNCWGPAAQ